MPELFDIYFLKSQRDVESSCSVKFNVFSFFEEVATICVFDKSVCRLYPLLK